MDHRGLTDVTGTGRTDPDDHTAAILTVTLPSSYTGGSSLLAYGGNSRCIDHSKERQSATVMAWHARRVAFASAPITSGHRIVLSYCLDHPDPLVRNLLPDPLVAAALVTSSLKAWKGSSPIQKCFGLAKQYSLADLSIDSLEGRDAYRAGLVVLAAEGRGLRTGLAVLRRPAEGQSPVLFRLVDIYGNLVFSDQLQNTTLVRISFIPLRLYFSNIPSVR